MVISRQNGTYLWWLLDCRSTLYKPVTPLYGTSQDSAIYISSSLGYFLRILAVNGSLKKLIIIAMIITYTI